MASEVRVAILGDSRDFSRAVRDARNDADRLDGTFSRVAAGAGRMSRAFGLAAVGGIAIGAHAVRGFLQAAEESQQVTRQTEAVIRSMGGVSNVTAQQVSRLSTRLSLMSGVDDELIQSGQNVLLTFGQVRNEMGEGNNVFDRATEAALNMSVALGTDLNSAAMMVGKALNDPIRGLTALRRSGIQFTREQEDQIRAMVEAGNVMGAQRVMLRELERQFGGSAEAQATASDKLRVAWGNIQEQIGGALLPAFEATAMWLTERLPGALTFAGEVVDDLRSKWETFTTFLFGEEDWDSFWTDVRAGWTAAQDHWTTFTSEVKLGWEVFTEAVFGTGTDWDTFWSNVGRGIDETKGKFGGLVDTIQEKWEGLNRWADEHIPWFFNPDGSGPLDDIVTGPPASGPPAFPLPGPESVQPVFPSLLPPAIPRSEVTNPPSWGMRTLTGPFHDGGVVPGRGEKWARVMGGETILPTHKSGMAGVTNIFYGEPDEFMMRVADRSGARMAREVRRDLNWSVG